MNRPLFGDDRKAETRFEEVERARDGGDWSGALDLATVLLRERIARGLEPMAGDYVLTEVTADLATAFGLTTGAADLISALALLCDEQGRSFLADYLTLKAVALGLDEGRWEDARRRLADRLKSLASGRSNGSPFGRRNFKPGRTAVSGPTTTRRRSTGSSSSLDYTMRSGGGWRPRATTAMRLSFSDAGCSTPPPPRRWPAGRGFPWCWNGRACLFEQGLIGHCRDDLVRAEARLDPRVHPGWTVHWLELTAHRERLLSDFGSALRRYDEVTEMCRGRGFVRATAVALMNQAEILIMINRVSEAEDMLATAADLVSAMDVPGAQSRFQWLRAVAAERVRSPAERLALTPAVIELRRPSRRPPMKGLDHDVVGPGAGLPPAGLPHR